MQNSQANSKKKSPQKFARAGKAIYLEKKTAHKLKKDCRDTGRVLLGHSAWQTVREEKNIRQRNTPENAENWAFQGRANHEVRIVDWNTGIWEVESA